MSPEQLEQFQEHVAATIEKTVTKVVNGKIDGLRKDFTQYVLDDTAWKEEELKRNAPIVAAFDNTNWLFRLFVSTLKLAAVLGAGIGAIIYLKDKILK